MPLRRSLDILTYRRSIWRRSPNFSFHLRGFGRQPGRSAHDVFSTLGRLVVGTRSLYFSGVLSVCFGDFVAGLEETSCRLKSDGTNPVKKAPSGPCISPPHGSQSLAIITRTSLNVGRHPTRT